MGTSRYCTHHAARNPARRNVLLPLFYHHPNTRVRYHTLAMAPARVRRRSHSAQLCRTHGCRDVPFPASRRTRRPGGVHLFAPFPFLLSVPPASRSTRARLSRLSFAWGPSPSVAATGPSKPFDPEAMNFAPDTTYPCFRFLPRLRLSTTSPPSFARYCPPSHPRPTFGSVRRSPSRTPPVRIVLLEEHHKHKKILGSLVFVDESFRFSDTHYNCIIEYSESCCDLPPHSPSCAPCSRSSLTISSQPLGDAASNVLPCFPPTTFTSAPLLEEKADSVHITPQRRELERTAIYFAHCIHVGALLEEDTDNAHMTIAMHWSSSCWLCSRAFAFAAARRGVGYPLFPRQPDEAPSDSGRIPGLVKELKVGCQFKAHLKDGGNDMCDGNR
ncbi:hypothetical protein DFH06DRAFT_673264 [Mycena polygramma]|nr:hypothetical protein DFH06DRAFT_673264 [Mycena polygramma]